MWPAIVTGLQNVEADSKTNKCVKAKVTGMLKKFRNYGLICKTCCYLDLLEAVGPASKVFEGRITLIDV